MNWFKKLFAHKHTDENGFTWTYQHPYWWLENSYHKDGKTFAFYASVFDEKEELDDTVQYFMAHNTKDLRQ